MTELIRALRCSNSTEHIDCVKEKCKYFYREPQEVIDKFREEHGGKFREFPDDIFETCDCEQIALDAADELERLCEDREKYQWHDLRKNPDDLPEMEGCFNVYLWLKPNDAWEIEEKYIYSTQYFYGKFKNSSLWDVIAWREIEPFEPEDYCPLDYHGGDC